MELDFIGWFFAGFSLIFLITAGFSALIFVIIFILIIKNFSSKHKLNNQVESVIFNQVQELSSTNQVKETFDLSCDHCGAKATNLEDLSPNGDLRCEYCQTWFNVKS